MRGESHALGNIERPAYQRRTAFPGGPGLPDADFSESDYLIIYQSGPSGAQNYTPIIPLAANYPGRVIAAKKIYFANNTTHDNTITLTPSGGNTIEGAANFVFSQTGMTFYLMSDGGTNWVLVAGYDPGWYKFGANYVDLSVAALTNNIQVAILPAGGIIQGCKIKHSTAFSGGAIASYKVSVGLAGDAQRYAANFDVFAAVAAGNFQASEPFDSQSHTATTSIKLFATSTGANLNAATAGRVDVWLKYAPAVL